MSAFRNATLAVTLGLAAAIAASPAVAKKRSEPAGYAARAEAIGADTGGLTLRGARLGVARLQRAGRPLRDYTWGDQQFDHYRLHGRARPG